jgi:hypothetical protein
MWTSGPTDHLEEEVAVAVLVVVLVVLVAVFYLIL